MDQHVISEWLLKAFARKAPGGPLLEVFDKATGQYESATPDQFMTEVDAHSTAVEHGIGAIEAPSALAARRLAKRVKGLPPGLYAIVPSQAPAAVVGPAVSDMGVHEGMRLLLGEHRVTSPSDADRIALGRYAGLMYQRAPKNETAMMRFRAEFDLAAQQALDRLLPGIQSHVGPELEQRRSRMLTLADTLGSRLAEANWWVVRAEDRESFVLSDSPVAATLSLGHDGDWLAILSPETYAVVMPLGPTIALVMAPHSMFPVTGIDLNLGGLTKAINRLMWRWADRYVIAGHRSQLERAWPEADEEQRRSSVQAPADGDRAASAAWRTVMSFVVGLLLRDVTNEWLHWRSCRLEFGMFPWPAEDRRLFASMLEPPRGPRISIEGIGNAGLR